MKKKEIDPRVLFVCEDFARRVKERENLERSWTLNLNFYSGNQQAEVLPTGEMVTAKKRYPWQENEVYNHIAPIIEARLSKFSNIRAQVSVVPATGEQGDIETAKLSTKLLRAVEEENDFKKKVAEATFWSELAGTAFYKVIWSPTKGKCLSEKDGIYEGDAEITVCPPYEIYPDNLTASDVTECRSIIHAKAYPICVIEDTFGVKVHTGGAEIFSVDSASIGGNSVQKGRNHLVCGTRKEDYVTVLERYSLPDEENKGGRLLIVAGDTLLYDGDLPYKVGENGNRALPFVRQACVSMPSSFFGTSLIERMIPVQRAYNAVKNRKHEFFNRLTAGVLFCEEGSVDLEELEESGIEPGKAIVYRQGSNEPTLETVGNVPSEFGEEEDRLLSEFVSISGVSDYLLSSGYTANNMSGIALKLIMQQDNNRLALVGDNIRFASKEVGQMILRLYKQFATIGRLKKIYGENGSLECAMFSANDISGCDVAFDFEEESVNSLELRKETVKELYEMGLMADENGKISDEKRIKLVEMLGFGNWSDCVSAEELHKKKAMRENIKSKKEYPVIDRIDNHTIHIEEHTKYLLQEECPLKGKQRENFVRHIDEHKKLLKQEQ